MFIKPYHLIFIFILIYGTIASISSNNWFTAWVGLEINLISIVPLILTKLTSKLSEAAIKYFIIQAIASTILIVSANLSTLSTEIYSLFLIETSLITALALKGGAAPFHFWFPQVIIKLNWTQCFLILTWQKIAPLLLITNIRSNRASTLACASVILGALRGLNQTNFKLLITHSSISHTGWIIISSLITFQVWLNYFAIYCLLTIRIIFSLKKSSIKKIQDTIEWQTEDFNKKILTFNIFSLAGLPPFIGFIIKISVILFILKINITLLMLIFILSSLISLFFYYRITYSSLINTNKHKKINNYSYKTQTFFILIICTIINLVAPFFSLMI